LTLSVLNIVMMLFSGTLTGSAISYLKVHISGAKTILSNHPPILDKTHCSVS